MLEIDLVKSQLILFKIENSKNYLGISVLEESLLTWDKIIKMLLQVKIHNHKQRARAEKEVGVEIIIKIIT